MLTFTRNSFGYVDGDSICAPNLSYQSINGVRFRIQSKYYKQDPIDGSFRRPIFVNTAVSGSTSTDILARVTSGVLRPGLTHLIIGSMGINDVFTAVPLATSIANFHAIVATGVAAGLEVMIVGPCWLSERWPSGITVYGPAIDTLDNAFIAAAEGLDVTYVSVRKLIYDAKEPVYNAPSPGVDAGVLTTTPTTIGEHPNPFGNTLYRDAEMPNVTTI